MKSWVCRPNPLRSGAHKPKKVTVRILSELVPTFPVAPGLKREICLDLRWKGKPEGPRR